MLKFALPAVALFAAAFVLGGTWSPIGGPSARVEAHGIIDQSQTSGTTQEFNGQRPMQQSFQPTVNSLVGVDVKGNGPFGDEPNMVWQVLIRRSFRFGPILAMQTMVGISGTPTVYHVDFPAPVQVVPGDTYWIEVAGEGNHFLWITQLTGNPYANGEADADITTSNPDADRYFVTYSGTPFTATPTPTPVHTAAPTARPTRTPH